MIDIVSWNVLADAYVRADYFPNSPAAVLARGARTGAIRARVLGSGADVVCLQEVEPALVDGIDYVFADERLRAAPRAVRDIDADTVLPSDDEPSDHLAIGARIEH